jgi:hypothetical protein
VRFMVVSSVAQRLRSPPQRPLQLQKRLPPFHGSAAPRSTPSMLFPWRASRSPGLREGRG